MTIHHRISMRSMVSIKWSLELTHLLLLLVNFLLVLWDWLLNGVLFIRMS